MAHAGPQDIAHETPEEWRDSSGMRTGQRQGEPPTKSLGSGEAATADVLATAAEGGARPGTSDFRPQQGRERTTQLEGVVML